MTNVTIILVQMAELFVMIGAGFLLEKIRFFHSGTVNDLNRFVLDVTMPAMILSASLSAGHSSSLPLVQILLASLVLVVLLPAVSYLILRLLHVKHEFSLSWFMMIYPNVGFMGFPLMKSIYGNDAMLYTTMINLAFNLSLFTFGKAIMQKEKTFQWKNFCTPGVISSIAAVIIYFLNIHLPALISVPLDLIGDMTTPLAMMIIGVSIADYSMREVFGNPKTYAFIVLIDILIPLLFFPLLKLLIQDQMLLGIAMIILAMPVANGAVMFARQYGRDELYAAETVCLSTLLSILTIPAVILICGL